MSFFGTFNFISANNEKFIENSVELNQNSTPTAVDDAVSAVHYASGVFYNPTELLTVTTTINILANDSYGSDGPTTAHEPLTLVNGKQSTATVNGGTITVSDNGTVNDKTDDVVTYLPPKGFSGTDSFTYSITDTSGDAATATVTITVAPEAPLEGAVGDAVSVDENSIDNLIDVLANDNFGTYGIGRMLINSPNHLTGTTSQGGTLTLDDGGTAGINQSDDKVLYTPPANFTGLDTFDYTLTVDTNQYHGTVTITVGNVAPVADTPSALDDTASVPFGSANNIISILDNDSYGLDGPTSAHEPLSLVNGKQSTATLNGGLISVSDNGTVNDKTDDTVFYSAPSGFSGTDSFTYSITDTTGDAATATVTITVNSQTNNPAVDDTVSVDENSSNNIIDVMANDIATTSNSHGSINLKDLQALSTTTTQQGGTIAILDNGTPQKTDDQISYTPPANFTGIDIFDYEILVYSTTLGAGPGTTYTATVTVTVGSVAPPVNDTPIAVDDSASVGFESVNIIIDVLANDSFGTDGPINGGLTMTNGTLNSASTNGGLISIDNKNTADTSDDEFNYSAPSGFSGTDTFNYTITDASGDASTATVTVTVAGLIIDVPTALDDAISVDENSIDNTIDVIVNDDFGSDGPYILPISLSSFNGAGSSHITQTTSAEGGSVVLNDNGTQDLSDDIFLFTPLANFTGTDTFVYYIYDANGDSDSAQVTITVGNVVPEASIPTAVDDSISVAFESANNIISILGNDSYGSDGPITEYEPLSLVNGKQSTATLNGGLISVSDNGTENDKTDDFVFYSAPSGFSGTDSFTYSITDATGDAATATVTITVAGLVIDVPSALDDSISVAENSTDNIIDILANDSFGSDGSSDPPMSFSAGLFTQGFYIVDKTTNQGGTATIINDTVIHYTPPANFVGTDTFGYYIYDSGGDRSSAIVTVTVGSVTPPVNDTPTTVDDTLTVNYESTNNVIDVLNNDSFGTDGAIDGGLTMTNGTLNSASTNGGLISVDNKSTNDTSDDEFIYNAPSGFSGMDTFSYTITDASGDASTGTVTVTVNPIVPIEGAVEDIVSVDENSVDNVIDVLTNDNFGTVGVGTLLIISAFHLTATTSQGGIINLDNNGTGTVGGSDDKILYTPPANFTGIDTFPYLLRVGTNEYTGTVTVTVGTVAPPASELTAVDDAITIQRNGTASDQDPIFIDVLANDSFGANGAMTAHNALSLRNGKLIEASEGGRTIKINDNGTPSDYSDDRVQYFPSGNSNFTSDSFTYTITDNVGVAITAIVTITYEDATSQKTSVNVSSNTIFENNFLAYPNPSRGNVKATLLSTFSTKATLFLSDVTGKIVERRVLDLKKGVNQLEFDFNVKSGLMLLKVMSSEVDYGTSKIVFK